jgi:hypothetical protein
MSQPLVPCPSCARHVLATERACPFCAASLPEDPLGRAVLGPPRRLTRAAAWVIGASLAVASCSGEVTTGNASGATSGGLGGAGGGPNDDGGFLPLYGAVPPPDAGNDGAAPTEDASMDAPDEDGSFNGPYGSPPPPPKDGG